MSQLRPALLVPVVLALTLGACGSSAGTTPVATTTPPAAGATSATALTLTDAWTKTTEGGMTATFGTLRNPGPTPVTVTSASSPVASMVELHEVVTVDGVSQMRPKEGGFVVPAGGELVLSPGGDHLMLMGVSAPLLAGDSVPVTLTWAGGSTTVETVAKDFAGGNETYAPTMPSAGMP